MNKDQFIRRGDASCVRAQQTFVNADDKFKSGQLSDLAFARIRFGISKRQVSELTGLEPRAPISVRGSFREYVAAIERVHEYDRQALAAAKQADTAGIDTANQKNLAEIPLRYRLARDIGFQRCSLNSKPLKG